MMRSSYLKTIFFIFARVQYLFHPGQCVFQLISLSSVITLRSHKDVSCNCLWNKFIRCILLYGVTFLYWASDDSIQYRTAKLCMYV